MAITPQEIDETSFEEVKRGYDTNAVDAFLDRVSGEVDAMLKKIADLKGRLNSSEQQLAAAQAQIAQLKEQGAANMTMPAPAPAAADLSASERQISQVLIIAQQSADRLVDEANANADKIKNDAEQKARSIIQNALDEKQGELDEIDRLKASREEFRTEYKKLLQHFMDDADSVFPEKPLESLNGSAAHKHAGSFVTPAPVAAEPEDAPASDGLDAAPANPFGAATPDTDFSDLD